MKQGTLFYDNESERYNFHYIDGNGKKCDYVVSIVEKSLSKTKRKSKMPKNAI